MLLPSNVHVEPRSGLLARMPPSAEYSTSVFSGFSAMLLPRACALTVVVKTSVRVQMEWLSVVPGVRFHVAPLSCVASTAIAPCPHAHPLLPSGENASACRPPSSGCFIQLHVAPLSAVTRRKPPPPDRMTRFGPWIDTAFMSERLSRSRFGCVQCTPLSKLC